MLLCLRQITSSLRRCWLGEGGGRENEQLPDASAAGVGRSACGARNDAWRIRPDGRHAQVSRALADLQLADEVLEQGIQNALTLLGIEHHG
jgi:hypothetical protein